MSAAKAARAAKAPAEPWIDRLLELEVGPVAHGGHCVARYVETGSDGPGRVVFVRHALPGERVYAVVTEDAGGSFCRADAVTVLEASPDRVEASCAWAGPGGCGGCDWQHATPQAQRALKASVVAEQLSRLAGIERDVTVEELPGGPLGWRTRMRMAVTEDGRPGLRAHRSHDVLPVGACPIAAPGLLEPVLAQGWTPSAEVEIVRDADGVVHAAEAVDDAVALVLGTGEAHERAGGRDWRLPASSFWQVHPHAADAVTDAVLAGVGDLADGGTAWDLYGGAGLLAAPLAERVGVDGRVVLVESDPDALAAAEHSLADLPALRLVRGRVERVLAWHPELADAPDVVVADPPRRGLGRELATTLAARGPRRIVHVACDPAALARDVAAFGAAGYELADLRVFDAFPMTHHIEAVAVLAARGAG